MSHLDQIWDNLLKISQGNASVYERTTSSFEKREGTLKNTYSTSYSNNAANNAARSGFTSNR
jgi:hypothetical protein